MILLLLLLLLAPAHHAGIMYPPMRIRDAASLRTGETPAFDELKQILAHSSLTYPEFRADFYTEAARRASVWRNDSAEDFARTCFDFYYAGRGLESALKQEDFSALRAYMKQNNVIDRLPENWREIAPMAATAITASMRKLTELAERANSSKWSSEILNATNEFMRKLAEQARTVLISLLINNEEVGADLVDIFVREIALMYKALRFDVDRWDVELTLCLHNVLGWLSASTEIFKGAADAFDEVYGLDVSYNLRGSEYLSNQSIDDVKATFKRRAEKLKMIPQEYVDKCAESVGRMRIEEEGFERDWEAKDESFMGKLYGKKEFKNESEVLQALSYEGVVGEYIREKKKTPFIIGFTKRRHYIIENVPFLTYKTRAFLETVDTEATRILFNIWNRAARNGTEKIEFPIGQVIYRFMNDEIKRELEQVYCLQSALEFIYGREIDLTDYDYSIEY